MTDTLIELEAFSYAVEQKVLLRNIQLRVQQGEKIALIGPSGAGKSTLLHCLYQSLRHQAAFCPQQLGLVDALSTYHNIYMGRLEQHSALYNLLNLFFPWPRHKHAVAALCESLQLTGLVDNAVAMLSGGERQRVAIGRALYSDKTLFIGDEPLSSLDPALKNSVLASILNRYPTLIVSLHDPELALQHFDRILGLRKGELCFDLPSNVVSAPQLQQLYAGDDGH